MSPITVIVPTFNRARMLVKCLESLLSQTLPPAQLIVVNDGSSDETIGVLKDFSSHVEVITTSQLGKPAALNHGLRAARGEYVWIFDDDDVALPDALARLIAPLERDPRLDFTFCPYYFTEEDPTTGKLTKILRESYIPDDLDQRGMLIPLLEGNYLGGAAVFARRRVYDRCGFFDETLLRSQDYEMAIRLVRNCRGVRVPGPPSFHYRQHAGKRGPLSIQFPAHQNARQWLYYDQKFFTRLYHEIPLNEYLPPGVPLNGQERRAVLQRMRIMAGKFLTSRVIQDLGVLEDLAQSHPFSPEEREGVRSMFWETPHFAAGGARRRLILQAAFFRAVGQLSRRSPAIRQLKDEMVPILREVCFQSGPWQIRTYARARWALLAGRIGEQTI